MGGEVCLLGHLKCFKVNVDLATVLVCPQKLKSGPHFIMLSFISIFITSFGFEPFILHCFVSQSTTVEDEAGQQGYR